MTKKIKTPKTAKTTTVTADTTIAEAIANINAENTIVQPIIPIIPIIPPIAEVKENTMKTTTGITTNAIYGFTTTVAAVCAPDGHVRARRGVNLCRCVAAEPRRPVLGLWPLLLRCC